MGDTSNWEFAAAVAAVTMGLGGLLVFTLVTTINSWRLFDRAARAAGEAATASVVVQDLARQIAMRDAASPPVTVDLSQAMTKIESLRAQADALMAQQTQLQDAVRNLVEAGVLRGEGSRDDMKDLEGAVRRLEDHLAQVAAAVANLATRQT